MFIAEANQTVVPETETSRMQNLNLFSRLARPTPCWKILYAPHIHRHLLRGELLSELPQETNWTNAHALG